MGVLTYYLAIFLPKTTWKWKNLDLEGACIPSAPPWIRQWFKFQTNWFVTSHFHIFTENLIDLHNWFKICTLGFIFEQQLQARTVSRTTVEGHSQNSYKTATFHQKYWYSLTTSSLITRRRIKNKYAATRYRRRRPEATCCPDSSTTTTSNKVKRVVCCFIQSSRSTILLNFWWI